MLTWRIRQKPFAIRCIVQLDRIRWLRCSKALHGQSWSLLLGGPPVINRSVFGRPRFSMIWCILCLAHFCIGFSWSFYLFAQRINEAILSCCVTSQLQEEIHELRARVEGLEATVAAIHVKRPPTISASRNGCTGVLHVIC